MRKFSKLYLVDVDQFERIMYGGLHVLALNLKSLLC